MPLIPQDRAPRPAPPGLARKTHAELEALIRGGQTLRLELDPLEALALLAQLQLALRHPRNVGPSTRLARGIAAQVEAFFTGHPGLELLVRLGWDPAYDVDVDAEAP